MVLLDIGTPGISREIYSEDADDGTLNCTPQCSAHRVKQLKSYRWEELNLSVAYWLLHHYILIISKLCLTSSPRRIVVLLDKELLISVKMPMMGPEPATSRL